MNESYLERYISIDVSILIGSFVMEPIVFLMKEHRVIQDMVKAHGFELDKERKQKSVDFPFLDTAIDFFKTYADRCHHGKEEGILFRELSKKPLSTELKK